MTGQRRGWSGTTLTDRRAARREQLVEAGLDLLGAEGGPAASVRAVCRGARLTERYFYENFADREELVRAVYGHVGGQAHRVVAEAVRAASQLEPQPVTRRAEAAVAAFVDFVLDDPRKGRVLLLAPISDPALSGQGVALVPAFAALVHEQLSPGTDELDRQLRAIGLVGALTGVFISYLNGSLPVPRPRLVAHCVRLVVGVAELDGGPAPAGQQ